MLRGLALVVLAACGARQAQPQAPANVRPTIEIAGASCVAAPDLEQRLRDVLATHRAERSGLRLAIVETPGEPATVTLQVVRADGEVGLDRSYTFGATDCASAAQVLALTVDRWLSSFPEWALPPAPPRPPTRWTEVALVSALNTMWRPFGVDGHVGVLIDSGGRAHRFGGTVIVRASIPQAAGSGRFQQTAFLAGASWRHERGPWLVSASARGGALLVNGIGYAVSESDWLPWWEGAVFGGRDVGWGTFGLEIAASGLRHRAVTRDNLVSEDIPLLRIGVAGLFGLNP